jgi:60 kDa SS-A/Ro ribonucleoprotein
VVALKIYGQGHGDKGSLTWTPVTAINDALDAAFYAAFPNVVPAGKRTLIGLDVSGSMGYGVIAGMPLTPAEAAAAFAMVVAKTEPQLQLMAFAEGFRQLDISGCSRLADVLRITAINNFGGTDCALPMTWATSQGINVDTFVVITDCETWAGNIHPCQALEQYRQKTGIPARSVVVGMTATGFTIADPNDGGMLDVAGYDTNAPVVINDFSRGA